jgi:hypothetical protein
MILDAKGRALRRTIGFVPELLPAKPEGSDPGIELISTEKVALEEEYIALEECPERAAILRRRAKR